MNKVRFIKLSSLLICLVSLNIYGQRKEISKEEFLSANKNASEKMKTLSYRFVSKAENYFGDELNSVQSNSYEFIPPDIRHHIFEVKMLDRKQTFLTETISIGSDEYKRENGGDWIKRIRSGANQSPNNPIKTVENNSKFYLTENVQFGSQTANLYEAIIENKVSTPPPAANETTETIFYRKEKRWISRDGLLLKMEMEDESQQLRKVLTRQTITYEYNPKNLKIEAPIK